MSYRKNAYEVLKELKSDANKGLSTQEAARRRSTPSGESRPE